MKNKKLLTMVGSICLILVLAALPFMAACAKPAPTPPAEPIVLKALSVVPIHIASAYTLRLLRDTVNERAKGELIIDLAGGPEVIGVFDQPKALSTGVIDFLFTPTVFYTDRLPEADAWSLSNLTPSEERESGFYDFGVELHKEKMNAMCLGRANSGRGFNIFTNVHLEKPQDLGGLRMAGQKTWFALMEALGAVPTTIVLAEQYTAFERGVIDCSIESVATMKGISAYEVVKWMVVHEFHRANQTVFLVNLDKWNTIPKHLQDLLLQAAADNERPSREFIINDRDEAIAELVAGGMKQITWSEEDAKWFIDLTYELGFERLKQIVSPENYIKIRQLTGH